MSLEKNGLGWVAFVDKIYKLWGLVLWSSSETEKGRGVQWDKEGPKQSKIACPVSKLKYLCK